MEKSIKTYVAIQIACDTHRPYIFPYRDPQKASECIERLKKLFPEDTYYIIETEV